MTGRKRPKFDVVLEPSNANMLDAIDKVIV